MTATEPTEADASGDVRRPDSVDEVPVFTTQEHLDYLIGLIVNEWKKTMVKWDGDAPSNLVNPINNEELQIYRPRENSVIKFRVDKVPDAIHHKVNALEHMQRIGLPNLPDLVKMAKEELAKDPFSDNPDESGDEHQLTFTHLLSELAMGRICTEYLEKEDMGFTLPVVFLDGSSKMRVKQWPLHHDTDFASFLAITDDYLQGFNLNTDWAESHWEEKIQELKEEGYDDHPKLIEVEQLIAAHKATNYDDQPKWMFFKTNQRIHYAKPIENEDDFRKILEIVTNPEKNNRLACMVRTVDKNLILIHDELNSFELSLGESETPSDEVVPGGVSFSTRDCSFDFLARTVGAPLNFALLGEDEAKGEDK